MPTLRSLLVASAALALLPAAAADAAPKRPAPPKAAVFKATISGSQVTTWSLRQAEDPGDPCDVSQKGDGSQMVRFRSKAVRVTALRLSGQDVVLSPTIPAATTVEREGDYAPGREMAPDCPAVAEGADDGLVPLTRDCGRRTGTTTIRLSAGRDVPDGELTPLTANVLWMAGDLGTALSYADCPWWIGGPGEGPSETALLPDSESFTVARLFDRRRKVLRVSGDTTVPYRAPGFTGKTLMTWNLKLVRVR
jgi:hypothetical protein